MTPRHAAVAMALLTSFAPAQGEAEAIEHYLELCAAHGWSGVALVEKDGVPIVHRGFGFADREAERENDRRTLFEIASVTKPFTACAIMALVEAGKLSLDDEIHSYLPGVPKDKRGITVRHLLSHTSGMARMSASGHGADLEQAVRDYLADPAAREPGETYEYWNGGFALLAGIIERASGTSYQEYCRVRLFEPAKLDHTGFTGEVLPGEHLAIGHDGDRALRPATGHPYESYGYQYRGMGGLVTTAEQLARFARALAQGEVLQPESVEAMWSAETRYYGLGWSVQSPEHGRHRTVGHGGSVAGFHTEWKFYPDEDHQIVLMSNVNRVPMFQLAGVVEALLFGTRSPFPMPPEPAAINPAQLDLLAGRYELADGSALVMTRGERRLEVAVETSTAPLKKKPDIADAQRDVASQAVAITEAVAGGDANAIAKVMGDGIPPTWPHTLTRTVWPAHEESYGPLQKVVALEVDARSTGFAFVHLRLEHENTLRPLKVGIFGGKLSYFDLAAPLDAFGGSFVRCKDGSFQRFDWSPMPPATMHFDSNEQPTSVKVVGGMNPPQTLRRAR